MIQIKAGYEIIVDRGVDHRQSHMHKKNKHKSKLFTSYLLKPKESLALPFSSVFTLYLSLILLIRDFVASVISLGFVFYKNRV